MAVPGSGTLSLLGIRRELGDDDYNASTNYTNISLIDCSDGTVDTINTQNNASFRPIQGDGQDAMSEFYGYDHDLANLYTLPTPTVGWSDDEFDQYGLQGVERDMEKAVVWYRRAADKGYDRAMVALGRCYEVR